MPVGHISLPTGPSQFKEMRDFYLRILEPLGYAVYMEDVPKYCGLGTRTGGPDFWLHCGGKEISPFDGKLESREGKTHVAFKAGSPRAVDAWYANAIKAGAVSNGEPGERPEYVAGYYAAFVIDPLGNNIEAVCFSPWWMKALESAPFVLSGLVGIGLALGFNRFYG